MISETLIFYDTLSSYYLSSLAFSRKLLGSYISLLLQNYSLPKILCNLNTYAWKFKESGFFSGYFGRADLIVDAWAVSLLLCYRTEYYCFATNQCYFGFKEVAALWLSPDPLVFPLTTALQHFSVSKAC